MVGPRSWHCSANVVIPASGVAAAAGGTADRELDESTLAMPQGSKLARRILPDTVLKRRGYLTRLTLNWLSTYATNYRMWLALGGVGLLLYYFL